MLERILNHIKNWFVHEKIMGQFAISNNTLALAHIKPGQYYRIIGSVFNDGLHKQGVDTLTDEEFDGAVWLLAIPWPVIDLAERIEAWEQENAKALSSAYQSESFGGYTYTKASVDGKPVTWQGAFRAELNAWRKI